MYSASSRLHLSWGLQGGLLCLSSLFWSCSLSFWEHCHLPGWSAFSIRRPLLCFSVTLVYLWRWREFLLPLGFPNSSLSHSSSSFSLCKICEFCEQSFRKDNPGSGGLLIYTPSPAPACRGWGNQTLWNGRREVKKHCKGTKWLRYFWHCAAIQHVSMSTINRKI